MWSQNITVQNFPGDGISVDALGGSANVHSVRISNNILTGNRRGVLVNGGNLTTGRTVIPIIARNTITDSSLAGISVLGNSGAGVGNNDINVSIEENTVRTTKQAIDLLGEAFGGDGIQVVGATNAGSNNLIKALVNENRPSLKFPLSVGQKWTYEYETRPAGARVSQKRSVEVNVTGIEEVITPGGSFRAYKLVRNEEWQGGRKKLVWLRNTVACSSSLGRSFLSNSRSSWPSIPRPAAA